MESLEEKLSGKNIFEVIDSIDYSLQLLKPDGKTVHNIITLRACLIQQKIIAKMFRLEEANFKEYKASKPEHYNRVLKVLTEIQSKYGINF
ncbi:hypothetical protein HYV89_00810 [Candidatus Woesearchaeota archaeon]|nr:hypothetical protein [Candidatus Woesearchaeota archaeon]